MTQQQDPYQPPVAYPQIPAQPPKRRGGIFGWILFIGLAIMLFLLLQKRDAARVNWSFDEFENRLKAGKIESVTISDSDIYGRLAEPVRVDNVAYTRFRTRGPAQAASDWMFIQWVMENRNGASVEIDDSQNVLVNIIVPLIPWLLIFGFLWFFVFRQMRNARVATPRPIPVYQVPPPVPQTQGPSA